MQPRAIIIDRVDSLRDLLSVALRDRGYEVFSFSDPEACPLFSGRETDCRQEFPCCDLLVIDNPSPERWGLEFIRRQMEGGCKGKVAGKAIMAAEWSEEDLEEARSLGCKVFTKPFRFREFTAWLDSRQEAIDPERKLADLAAAG